MKNFCEDLFFFFLESTCACVLGPWPRAFLSLASRVSVLGKAVLGLGFFCVLGLGLESCVLDSTSANLAQIAVKTFFFVGLHLISGTKTLQLAVETFSFFCVFSSSLDRFRGRKDIISSKVLRHSRCVWSRLQNRPPMQNFTV